MIDKLEPKYMEFKWPDGANAGDLFEFMKTNLHFSINVNSDDPKVQKWIRDHKDWFKKGGE